MKSIPSVGIEEEYQLVDPISGVLVPHCKYVMRSLSTKPSDPDDHSAIQHELHLSQIEMASDVCQTLDEVRDRVQHTRRMLGDAAAKTGGALAAAGTHPMRLPEVSSVTPGTRYETIAARFQHLARELLIFGCHVHVSMPNRELGVAVMNRSRRWLPLLQAITANSPYWDEQDTGYASYRRELWMQWPLAGPPPHFDSLSAYQSCARDLIRCGVIDDESYLFWDIRLPTKVPTIEFRCADVLTSIDHAVGYVGLVRALVVQSTEDAQNQTPFTPPRSEVMRFAMWQAARYGVSEQLVDPATLERIDAAAMIECMIDQIQPALEHTGDREIVEKFVGDVVQNGCGADRQRRSFHPSEDLREIVLDVVKRTQVEL